MKNKINSNFLTLITLLALWILPLLQSRFNIFEIEVLGGVSSTISSDTLLDKETWLSGRYAEKKQDYLTSNFGFREIAIRVQNQIQYSFFDKTNANDVVVGKNNYLFETKYIVSFYGIDIVSKSYFEDKVVKLKFIQDTLAKLDKKLIFLFAPSKAAFFPEYVPKMYKKDSIITNYDILKPLMANYKINYMDYNAMFKRLKPTTPYALYPVAGTHWSEYGNIVALDSLCNYIEMNTNFRLPEFEYSDIKVTNGYGGTDNDMGKAINLLFLPDYGNLAYPVVHIINKQNMNKPNVLMISDSYWSSIYDSNRPKQLFNKHSFWFYYNNTRDYDNETDGKHALELNLHDELMKNDIICIMCTDPNLKAVGYGFIDDCYELFKTGKLEEVERKRRFEIMLNRFALWGDNLFVKKLNKMAKLNNSTVDSMITERAEASVH